MGDHRKLKTYKKKQKETKRPSPVGAEQVLPVDGSHETSRGRDTSHRSSTTQVKLSGSRVPSRSDVDGGNTCGTSSETGIMGRKTNRGDKDMSKKSGPTKERWLLTRKTWKYMQQAGRRLIPDGTQNRLEDLPKLEEHFQQVCRAEQKFILWSRKSSYPGAIAASRKLKRRIRASTRNRPQNKASSADEAEVDEFKENDRRAAVVIRLLHSYLNIADQNKRQSQQDLRLQDQKFQYGQAPITSQAANQTANQASYQTTSQANKQATNEAINQAKNTSTSQNTYSYGTGFVSSYGHQQQRVQVPSSHNGELESSIRSTAELLESLRLYSQASLRPVIPPEHITTDLLHNKNLLKKIYNDLKRQQLSLVLNRHTAASTNNLSHASSLTSLFNFRRDQSKSSPSNTSNVKSGNVGSAGDASCTHYGGSKESVGESHLQLLKDKFVRSKNQLVPFISVVKPAKTLTTQGMQTDFLQLHEIGNLRKEYEAHKKEMDQLAQAPEEEVEFTSKPHSRRKSSVDNEDISQSVSDTIKRYLRMARKKSVNDDAANRFKRVNYDRNLRNIRAKGEINPPGMDEGNSKATQTLDAWPLLHYNFIRGIDCEALLEEAHADWNSALQRRKQQQEEYLQQQQQKDASSKLQLPESGPSLQGSQGAGGMPPTSGGGGGSGGLFHSGTQFFSNLWHGYHHSAHDNSNNSTTSTTTNVTSSCNTSTTTSNTTNSLYNNATANIPSSELFNQRHNQTAAQHQQQQAQSQHQQNQYQQKINSSQQQHLSPLAAANTSTGSGTNQTQQSNMQKSKSSSNVGQFVSKKIWKSRSKSQSRLPATNKPQWAPQGNCIWMSPSGKRVVLNDARLRDLTEIERKILHRVAVEKINQLNIGVNVQPPEDISGSSSSSKSQKRRPLLIKRKALTTSIFDTGKKDDGKVNGGGLVFGVSIEKCVDNDRLHKSGSGVGGSASGGSDRGSRNSIISLLAGGGHNKANDHIGSCESLPARSTVILGQYDDRGGGGGGDGRGSVGSFMSPGAMKISRSQTDVRRGSQEDDEMLSNANDSVNMVSPHQNFGQQVPALVLECIKHIEEHGLNTVGIFRVSTSKKRVRQLKEGFDSGVITSLDSEICPHDAATILKEYLRDLPEPLLCRNLYKAFVKTQKIRNRRLQLEALSHLIQLLPIAHRDTLYVLLRFLARIVRSSDDMTTNDSVVTGNKMDSNNLATVIAPNILRSSDSGRNTAEQEIDEQIDVINVIRTMIDHYEELFRVPAEMMDEIYTNMMDTHPEQLDYLCDRRDITDRYDDDMDSGSSSTPLSSPPPIAVIKQQPTPFAAYTSTPDDYGPDGLNDRNSSARPVYSRDDFLHENAIKGGDSNRNLNPQRRERTSRMKYIESEGEISRRRRRERNLADYEASDTISPTKTTFNSNSSNWVPFGSETRNSSIDSGHQQAMSQSAQQQYQPQQQIPSRRLFPPYGDSGVVTASLKIPVQMQQPQQQTSQHQRNSCDTVNSGLIDLSDIPYIEDNGCGQEILTGSLHFGRSSHAAAVTAGAMAFQIPFKIDGRTTSSSSTMSDQSRASTMHQYTTDDTSGTTSAASSRRSSDNTIATQSPQRSPTMPLMPQQRSSSQGNTQRPEPPKRSSGRKVPASVPTNGSANDVNASGTSAQSPTTLPGQFGSLQTAHHHSPSVEPKLTPSISNIGGAVLRSKTADFERILKQNKKHIGSESIVGEDVPTSSGSGAQATSSGMGASSTSLATGSADSSSSSIFEDTNRSERQTTRSRQQQSAGGSAPIYKRQELISSAQRKSK